MFLDLINTGSYVIFDPMTLVLILCAVFVVGFYLGKSARKPQSILILPGSSSAGSSSPLVPGEEYVDTMVANVPPPREPTLTK